jgi:hypothetical protein
MVRRKVSEGQRNRNGRFFPYYNTTHFDLTDLQVYRKEEFQHIQVPCFIHSIRYQLERKVDFGLEENMKYIEWIHNLKRDMLGMTITTQDIRKITEKPSCPVNIVIYKESGKLGRRQGTYYPTKNRDESKILLEIGYMEEHYFPLIRDFIQCFRYTLRNYNEIREIEDFCDIVEKGEYYKKTDREKPIHDSFTVLRDLFLYGGGFVPMNIDTNTIESIYSSKINKCVVDETEKIPITDMYEFKEKERKENTHYWVMDFEAYPEKEHKPYLVSCAELKKDSKICSFGTNRCASRLLDHLCETYVDEEKPTIVLYAHNLRYDLSFMVDVLWADSFVGDTTTIYSWKGMYRSSPKCKVKKTISIELRDSWKLISEKLEKFGKMFSLETEKEVMNYTFYTDYHIHREITDFETYCNFGKGLTSSQRIQFEKNLEKLNYKKEWFNAIDYAQYYCEKDVELLRDGLLVFRDWIYKITTLDILDYLTISSIGWNYIGKRGCLEDIYCLQGTPYQFIKKCVVGGRVMCRNNESIRRKGKIQDFDAVSLYPSAMYYGGGWLRGLPKIIPRDLLQYSFLEQQSGYFVKIVIEKVNKNRSFPVVSLVDEKTKTRLFTNKLIGKEFYVDKYTLEDLIEFQNIEFSILEGYYFNEGRNTEICKVIKELFDERKIKKKEKNKIEKTYKLILNSIYGKSIEKEHLQKLHVKSSKDIWTFYDNNYKRINYMRQISEKKWVAEEEKTMNEHFAYPQIGVEVLSFSKRLMNRVMYLAEDNNIEIFYQDTDSLHLYDKDIEKLSEYFFEKYNFELIGEELGQFHSDFEDKRGILTDKKEVYSVEGIFISKKCYLDVITTDVDFPKVSYHIRWRSIPTPCIERYCIDNEISILELYEKIYDGEKIEINLEKGVNKLWENIDRPIFIFKNWKVMTNENPFIRTMKKIKY